MWTRGHGRPGLTERGSNLIEYVGGTILVVAVVAALQLSGAANAITSKFSSVTCSIAGNCEPKTPRTQPEIVCVRAPCGNASPRPSLSHKPRIPCDVAPCGTSRPRPSLSRGPQVYCFTTPCPQPYDSRWSSPRPSLKHTPPIECVRAPCGTTSPRPKPKLSQGPVVNCVTTPCPQPSPEVMKPKKRSDGS